MNSGPSDPTEKQKARWLSVVVFAIGVLTIARVTFTSAPLSYYYGGGHNPKSPPSTGWQLLFVGVTACAMGVTGYLIATRDKN